MNTPTLKSKIDELLEAAGKAGRTLSVEAAFHCVNLAPQMARALKDMMEALELIAQDDWSAVSGAERSWEYAGEVLARAKKELGCG